MVGRVTPGLTAAVLFTMGCSSGGEAGGGDAEAGAGVADNIEDWPPAAGARLVPLALATAATPAVRTHSALSNPVPESPTVAAESGVGGAWKLEDAPTSAGPAVVAYASRTDRTIHVDPAYRDRVLGILGAHVSVSTGHWRIRAPADPPLEPLTPGVPDREFEEIRLVPGGTEFLEAPGDIRVVAPASRTRVAYESVEGKLPDLGRALGGPWTVARCIGERLAPAPGGSRPTEAVLPACREDLLLLGVATFVVPNDGAPGDSAAAARSAWPVYAWTATGG